MWGKCGCVVRLYIRSRCLLCGMRPEHFSERHASSGRLRWGSGFRVIRNLRFRLVRSIWLFAGRRSRLPPHLTPAHHLSVRVAGCCRQLIRPWSPGTRARHRTDDRAQGNGRQFQRSIFSRKACQLSFWSRRAAETRGRSEPRTRLRSDALGPKRS